MAPNTVTVSVNSLPSDTTKELVFARFKHFATTYGCKLSVGPVVNSYHVGTRQYTSRSTTVTFVGKKAGKVVGALDNYLFSSNTLRQQIRVDQSFLGLTTVAENEDSTVE